MMGVNNFHFRKSLVAQACAVGLVFTFPALAAEKTEIEKVPSKTAKKMTAKDKTGTSEIEVIEVQGVRGSLVRSLNNKRYAQEILDTISAEDIGQLPDENIAEAMQRIAGISLTRADDGEGQAVQIRGDSSNNIEIDGQSVVGSNIDSPRAVNLQDMPSELFSKVEVLKASTADRIEGSLGGTVNLVTNKPLGVKKDNLNSVNLKAKYHELADEVSPDVTLFKVKNWRDTAYGDFGLLVNLNVKEVVSRDEAFGAATWGGAPSRWTVYTGLSEARGNWFTGNKKNPYDADLDPNQDGVSDENDIFYVPNLWKVYANEKSSDRIGSNVTLQWQPNERANLWLSGSYSKREDEFNNQFFSMQANTGTPGGNQWDPANKYLSFPLASGNPVFEHVNSTDKGDFYVMTAGRMGGVQTIMGGSPAVGSEESDTYQFTLGGDYELTEQLFMSAVLSSSRSVTDRNTSQLLMTHDYNGNGRIQENDFAAVLDFDERNVDFANITYYDAPLNTTNLVEMDPTDLTFDRLNYRQLQRNAVDVENTSDAFQLDFEYELDSAITSVQFGYRYAERASKRQRFMAGHSVNPNGVYVGDQLILPHIGNVPVFDESNQTSVDLTQCHTQINTELDGFSGSLPSTWLGTNCDSQFIAEYFGIPDIRAKDPATGDYYYQRNGQRYNNVDVEEATNALYFRANFFTEFFNTGVDFVGNFGVRYVTTDVTGIGWVDSKEQDGSNFEQVAIKSDYAHTLPSLNANWLLTDETILRFAWSKNLARPSLNQVAPSLRLNYVDDPEAFGYDGTGTAGNPALKPRTAENVDLSFEWYFADDALLSAAVFYKDIANVSARLPDQEFTINDETFLVNQWKNIGSTYLKGYELAWQQSFKFLPGLLKHTGINFNYTHPVESETLTDGQGDGLVKEGHSEDNVNLAFFYDDNTLSMRFAYVYRSEYVRNYEAVLGYGRTNDDYRVPQIVDEYGQLDFSANYKFTKNLKVNLSITNLTDEHHTWYLKHKQMTDRIADFGRKANLSIQYKF